MPYNVDKDQGGDSKDNTKWMENCVDSVMSKSGKDKPSAVAICKAQLRKNKEKNSEIEINTLVDIDVDILSSYNNHRQQWIRREMQRGFTFTQASSHYEIYLILNNYTL
jgi:hypothetical protein